MFPSAEPILLLGLSFGSAMDKTSELCFQRRIVLRCSEQAELKSTPYPAPTNLEIMSWSNSERECLAKDPTPPFPAGDEPAGTHFETSARVLFERGPHSTKTAKYRSGPMAVNFVLGVRNR